MANPTKAAQQMGAANTAQVSQALIIQTYANSVNEQPPVDFSADPNLDPYQTQINTGLTAAQGHANNYLTAIQPSIIDNLTNIENYYALNNAVPAALPAGSTPDQWNASLAVLQSQATTYQTAANGVLTTLQTLQSNLNTDAASFAGTVSDLNTAVNGDDGVLASVRTELNSIQGKIDGAIAGIVTSGFLIVGGGFMIAVGSVADFVTAGTSTPLVVGGIGVLAAGTAGEVGSAVMLGTLNDQKARLLQETASLTAEVQLALGISSAYQSLSAQVTAAVTAATQMESAWSFLSGDIGNMISDLNSGSLSTGEIRTLFLTAANTAVQTVLTDSNIIKGQMAGVTTIVAPPGQTVGQALAAAAQQSVAA